MSWLGDKLNKSSFSIVPDGINDDLKLIIDNSDGRPPIFGDEGDNVIYGTNKDDTIFADPTVLDDVGGDDVVYALDGDDVVYTFGGNDVVYGAGGDDTIQTADGDDSVYAGSGADDVQSGRGQDLVKGDDGDDSLRGGENDDHLYGGPGNDRIIGGSDDDTLEDGTGNDRLEGRGGDDLIVLVDDGESDRVQIRNEDVNDGVDTIVGFNTDDPENGGDELDLRDIEEAQFEVVQVCDQALIYASTADVPGPTLLAVVENVSVADLLDNNTRIGDDSMITEVDVDLTVLIGNALGEDGEDMEQETVDTSTADIASGIDVSSTLDTAYETQAMECLVTQSDEIPIA